MVFVPGVPLDRENTERTPKMRALLTDWFEVVPVPTRSLNKKVYDQKGNRFLRYVMFLADEVLIFFDTLRVSKREHADLVFAEGTYFSLAAGLAAKIRNIPMVWDNHGNIKSFSETLGKTRFFFLGNLMLEKFVFTLASNVLVVSEKEVDTYASLGMRPDKFLVVPTCADMDVVERKVLPKKEAKRLLSLPEDEVVILFFGTLKYMPNKDAALYISNDMMPHLRTSFPNAHVYLAGSGELGTAPSDGVVVLGFVPDLYTWLSASDICIAPMWKGVGILTKVIDMMSVSRPTIVSPLALDGIPELKDGVNCLVGWDPNDFTEKVASLLKDMSVGDIIANRGKELIIERYNWDVVGTVLRKRLEDLIEEG